MSVSAESLREPPPAMVSGLRLPATVLVWAAEVVAVASASRLFENCSVFVVDEPRRELVLACVLWGTPEDSGDILAGSWAVPFDGSVCGEVYRTGRPALIADVADDASYRTYPGARAQSELTVPISAAGRRIGVINIESSRVGMFGIADLEQLTSHAEGAGHSFQAAGLMADLAT